MFISHYVAFSTVLMLNTNAFYFGLYVDTIQKCRFVMMPRHNETLKVCHMLQRSHDKMNRTLKMKNALNVHAAYKVENSHILYF